MRVKEILESANWLYTNYVNDRPIAFERSVELRGAKKGITNYPGCFYNHHAPRSVVILFTEWVELARKSDNGIISINLQHQKRYSNRTAQKAIAWLAKHKLIKKTKTGVGQGVASKYLIEWSFRYKSLTERQKAVNSRKRFYKAVSYNSHTIEERLSESENNSGNNAHAFSSSVSDCDKFGNDLQTMSANHQKAELIKNKIDIMFHAKQPRNSQKPNSLIEKSTRYALFQLRKHTNNPDAINAAAKGIRRKMKAGKVFAGPELNEVIDAIASEDYDNQSTTMVYRMVGQAINEVIDGLDLMKERSVRWVGSCMRWENTANPKKAGIIKNINYDKIDNSPNIEKFGAEQINNSPRTLQARQGVGNTYELSLQLQKGGEIT